MRSLYSVLSLILLAASIRADQPDTVNKLTAADARAGWLLLFDGDSTFGWKIDGTATVKDGALLVGGDEATTARPTSLFSNFELRFEYRYLKGAQAAFLFRRGSGTSKHGLGGSPTGEWGSVTCRAQPKETLIETVAPGGGRGASRLGGDENPGRATVELRAESGTVLQVRNVKLQPLGAESLFNGKDLTGWKVFPDRKSTFAVVDGAINVKNGPGDLQTEQQWANFLLQLECISNGTHLNSGVFFRARPNEYQQGYEAQVRNQFTEEPKQEYTIEEFDPKTNEKTGATKVKLQAVDYGTGAIYRRVPARRAVAKDKEWFTLTVLADGRHLATWVNGVQVVDWTDHRPLADTARKGCYLNKGVISFQGHDPTTDLSFRNIRIQALPD